MKGPKAGHGSGPEREGLGGGAGGIPQGRARSEIFLGPGPVVLGGGPKLGRPEHHRLAPQYPRGVQFVQQSILNQIIIFQGDFNQYSWQ